MGELRAHLLLCRQEPGVKSEPQPSSRSAPPRPQVGATAAEVVKQCDITFAMVSDPEACLDLALGGWAAEDVQDDNAVPQLP